MTRAEMDGNFELDRSTYHALVEHARSDAPFEVCGLLATDDGSRVAAQYQIPNAARSMTYYNMDPKAMLRAFHEMDDREWDLLSIYHSHTHTEAFPSKTDVELAFYPDAVYVIVSLQDPSAPVVRAFNIRDGKITERAVTIDGEEASVTAR